MDNPLIVLIVGTIIIVSVVWFFFPNIGIYAKFRRNKTNNKRVLIEDSLKHIYDCETRNSVCNIFSIAGTLSISADDVTDIIEQLHEMKLIETQTDNINLTSEGRSYALRVIRIHRLLERYLADETSFHEKDWHDIAEEKEHTMSEQQVEELAAQLSNPFIDPHGDPIPSANGEIKEIIGISLNELKQGEVGRIVHIEDEPTNIYKQLVAQNLYRGKQIRILETNDKRIKFIANDEECILAPVFAANISVTKIENEEEIRENFKRLSSLNMGEKGTVIGISKKCRGQQRRRLMDFGFVPGSEITAEMVSFGGDPVAYFIKGTTIALRKIQSDLIYIK